MSKAKLSPVAQATTATTPTPVVEITSFKDAGYQSALSGERMTNVAAFVISKCPDFLNSYSDEVGAELKSGWALRWQELHPATIYSDEWVPNPSGLHNVSLAYCMSYSQQAFGQIKTDNPVKHGVIKGIRDDFSKYVSNRLSDLKRAVRKELDKGKVRERIQAKVWTDFEKDTFDGMKARCKTALARNDATAPTEVKLRMAIDAFKTALNK
jgi:hypothetical protein